MQLKQLGPNRTLVTFRNGTEMFFSYETPVAGRHAGEYFRTATKFSVTTSKMIGEYLRRKTGSAAYEISVVEQAWIDDLLKEMTK